MCHDFQASSSTEIHPQVPGAHTAAATTWRATQAFPASLCVFIIFRLHISKPELEHTVLQPFTAWSYYFNNLFHVNISSSSRSSSCRKEGKPECKLRPWGVEEATDPGEETEGAAGDRPQASGPAA